jgi:flagella synthesis protein FlgN
MTMSPVESLQACMKQEDALITEFSAILEEETKVLVGPGNVDALHDITERKGNIAQQLVDLSHTRDGLLAEIGLPAGHAGTEQAAVQHPQLSDVWQALLAKSASANEINMRNGALIDVHLRYTQQSLDALRQIGGLGGTSTYDAQGRGARATPGRKPIVAG